MRLTVFIFICSRYRAMKSEPRNFSRVSLRNCRLEEEYNKNFIERMGIAVDEDRIVIEKLDPPIPSREAVGEFIVPADDILMNYRRQRTAWEANGWRMNLEEMEKNRNRVAYAIPCPGRRENPEDWAVTSVPLLSGVDVHGNLPPRNG